MKRFIYYIVTAILILMFVSPAVALASDVTGANYLTRLIASNNSTSAATNEIVPVEDIETDSYIDAGLLNATATDAALRESGGDDVPFMWAANTTYSFMAFVDSVGALSSKDLYLYSDGAAGGQLVYIPGTPGMTSDDDPSMEFGGNFTDSKTGFFDATATGNFTRKDGAYCTFVNGDGIITAQITGTDVSSENYTPSANGAITGLSVSGSPTNCQAVDDPVGAPDDLTTWVGTTSAVYLADTYEIDTSNITATAANFTVTVHFRGYGAGTATAKGQPIVYLSGDNTTGTEQTFPNSSWQDYSESLSRPGGGTWTLADIGNIEIGLNLKGDGANNAVVTQVYANIAHTDIAITTAAQTSGNTTISVSIGDRPDFATFDSTCSVGMPFSTGTIPGFIIGEQELTAAASSVTFSNIDTLVANYEAMTGTTARHLVLMVNARSSAAANDDRLEVQFNSDTANNYSYQNLQGIDSTDGAGRATGVAAISSVRIPATNYASSFGGGNILLPHAFNTSNHKALLSLGGSVEFGVRTVAGRWASNSAITSITLTTQTTNDFTANSSYQLAVVDERYLVEEKNITVADNATFSSIPQDGGDLLAIGYARSDRAGTNDSIFRSFNNEQVSANSNRQRITGDGSSTAASSTTGFDLGIITGDTADASAFGGFLHYIPNYTGGNYTSDLAISGYHGTSSASRVHINSARWSNTLAVTDIGYWPNQGTNFMVDSLVSLYIVPRTTISTQTLTSAQPEVLFSNIPQEYEALGLVVYARSNTNAANDVINKEINADSTAANYDVQTLQGVAAVVSAQRLTANQILTTITGGTEGANEFGASITIFPQYSADDRHKHSMVIEGRTENAAIIRSMRWENLNPITGIKLTLSSGDDFMTNSYFELIGIMPTKTFDITVGGEVKAIIDANSANTSITVPDSTGEWNFVEGGVMSYLDSQTITVNGTQVQYIDWEYTEGDFMDSSGFGNDATPTYRTAATNANVTASIASQVTTMTAEVPASADSPSWTMVGTVPEEPPELYREGGSNYPGGAELVTLADDTKIDYMIWAVLLSYGLSLGLGVWVYSMTHNTRLGRNGSLFVFWIVSTIIQIIFVIGGDGVIPGWVLIPYGFACICLMVWFNPFRTAVG